MDLKRVNRYLEDTLALECCRNELLLRLSKIKDDEVREQLAHFETYQSIKILLKHNFHFGNDFFFVVLETLLMPGWGLSRSFHEYLEAAKLLASHGHKLDPVDLNAILEFFDFSASLRLKALVQNILSCEDPLGSIRFFEELLGNEIWKSLDMGIMIDIVDRSYAIRVTARSNLRSRVSLAEFLSGLRRIIELSGLRFTNEISDCVETWDASPGEPVEYVQHYKDALRLIQDDFQVEKREVKGKRKK